MSRLFPNLREGDELEVERVDEKRVLCTYVQERERCLVVKGTAGSSMGKEILIPIDKIMQITKLNRPRATWGEDQL